MGFINEKAKKAGEELKDSIFSQIKEHEQFLLEARRYKNDQVRDWVNFLRDVQ